MLKQPTTHNAEERMIGLISRHQVVLHDYLFALIQDASRTNDILQETNLVLWRKADEYNASRPFLPWARTIGVTDEPSGTSTFHGDIDEITIFEGAVPENQVPAVLAGKHLRQ